MGVYKRNLFFLLDKDKKVSFFLHPVIFSLSDSGWHSCYIYCNSTVYFIIYLFSMLELKLHWSRNFCLFEPCTIPIKENSAWHKDAQFVELINSSHHLLNAYCMLGTLLGSLLSLILVITQQASLFC